MAEPPQKKREGIIKKTPDSLAKTQPLAVTFASCLWKARAGVEARAAAAVGVEVGVGVAVGVAVEAARRRT